MQNSFRSRLILITGGSSGIGLALAQLLALEGARVWLLARRPDQLETAVAKLHAEEGQQHGSLTADVTKWDEVHAAIQRLRDEAGVPDVLINAAGAAHPGYVQETTLETYHEMMDLNYYGIVHTVQACLQDMLRRGSGYIVNFSSGAGFLAPFGYAAYAPSKFAVRGFSDILRLELKPLGIRVSLVYPPDTDTPGMANENKTKPFETLDAFSTKLLPAETVAKGVLRGMRRGQYAILPASEIGLYYHLTSLLGNGTYTIMDMMLAGARRKKAKIKGG